MFVIPCKYSAKNNHILPLVQDIRNFHSEEEIVVVDSDSDDKSYFEILKPYNVIIEDIGNKNWMIGAYWHAFKKYKRDFYYFLHDTVRIKANLDYLKERDLVTLATFNRMVSPSFNAWAEKITRETGYSYTPDKFNGKGCYGPLFFIKRSLMEKLEAKGVDKLLPSSRGDVGCLEGGYGFFFEEEGYNLSEVNLYGDILELESPGGKTGPPPHNTSWQFPVEKFYASRI